MKARQEQTRRAVKSAGHLGRARRPQYLFSGLTKCGVCGAGFIMAGRNRSPASEHESRGGCDNLLTIRRDELEARVLNALQEKLLRQDLFEEFCDEFTREMNRLRLNHRATLTAAEREIERIEVRRKKLVQSIIDGVPASEVRDELTTNAARREELKAGLAAAGSPPRCCIRRWPSCIARRWRSWQALEQPESRLEATEALRGLVDAIILTPSDGELGIELKGNLPAMLSAGINAKRSPETGDLSLQESMVAGARTQHYLQLWRPAA